MIKTTLAGALLFLIMVVTAVSVSRVEPSQGERGENASVSMQQQQPIQFLQSEQPPQKSADDEGGGLADNPLVVMAGITLILCFAVAFWKYHRILEQQKADEEPVKKKIRQ